MTSPPRMTRVDEVGRTVEAADPPRRLGADPVDGADEVAVGDGVGRLLELPEVLGEASDGRARVEDDLGAVEAEDPGALGEVAVVADVDPYLGVAGLEDRVAEVAGLEEVLLPEAGRLRDVDLAVLAEVGAVGVDHRRGVVVDAAHRLLVDGDDDDHRVLAGELRHHRGGRARHGLGGAVPAAVLAGAEVGAVEDLLEAEDLDAAAGGLFDHRDVLVEHRLLDVGDGDALVVDRVAALDEAAADDRGHVWLLGAGLRGLTLAKAGARRQSESGWGGGG